MVVWVVQNSPHFYTAAHIYKLHNIMNSEGINQSFAVSDTVKDFIFDLHDSTRRSFRMEDVNDLYDKFKVCFYKHGKIQSDSWYPGNIRQILSLGGMAFSQ
jgi:hypothetical protein